MREAGNGWPKAMQVGPQKMIYKLFYLLVYIYMYMIYVSVYINCQYNTCFSHICTSDSIPFCKGHGYQLFVADFALDSSTHPWHGRLK